MTRSSQLNEIASTEDKERILRNLKQVILRRRRYVKQANQIYFIEVHERLHDVTSRSGATVTIVKVLNSRYFA